MLKLKKLSILNYTKQNNISNNNMLKDTTRKTSKSRNEDPFDSEVNINEENL